MARHEGERDSTRVNADRMPPYHALNLRADRRWNFRKSNLILYLEPWNVYDRGNIAEYTWSEQRNERDTMEQWGRLTALGVEWEF